MNFLEKFRFSVDVIPKFVVTFELVLNFHSSDKIDLLKN